MFRCSLIRFGCTWCKQSPWRMKTMYDAVNYLVSIWFSQYSFPLHFFFFQDHVGRWERATLVKSQTDDSRLLLFTIPVTNPTMDGNMIAEGGDRDGALKPTAGTTTCRSTSGRGERYVQWRLKGVESVSGWNHTNWASHKMEQTGAHTKKTTRKR